MSLFSEILQILRKLKHENIIEMLDSFESPQEFCVVTEFAQVTILSLSVSLLLSVSLYIYIYLSNAYMAVLCVCYIKKYYKKVNPIFRIVAIQ